MSRLIELLSTRTLVLVRPRLWDDPFENFLYQVRARTPDGVPVSLESLRNKLYGQCWSFTRESDAMWRIYSPAKDGVKVCSTPRRLIQAISNKSDPFASLSYFVGKVEYLEDAELLDLFADPRKLLNLITDTSGTGPVSALLKKRKEFVHEKEIRLVYQSTKEMTSEVVRFGIDPSALFDEIIFDPRLEKTLFGWLKAGVKSAGYSGTINQSSLYQIPEFPAELLI